MKQKNRLVILLIVAAVITAIAFLFYKEGTLPVNKKDTTAKIFVIPPGQGPIAISRNLEKEGLVRSDVIFFLVIKRLGIEKKIQAGDFRLSPSMNAYEIAEELQHGTLDVWVTLQEGLRHEEIAEEISDKLDIPEAELLGAMDAKEGYLFPDTYLIPKDATSDVIVTLLTNTFEAKYQQLVSTYGMPKGLTKSQVVTIASLVEREAKFAKDRPQVASIIRRRLNEGIKLQIDATVQYALGYQQQEKSWWRKKIFFEDLEIDSPYNTYQITGLPASPISNPGYASLEAVFKANPETPYLFYVSDSTGRLHYARDDDEHQRNIEKYLQ